VESLFNCGKNSAIFLDISHFLVHTIQSVADWILSGIAHIAAALYHHGNIGAAFIILVADFSILSTNADVILEDFNAVKTIIHIKAIAKIFVII
jgi:hypothetical protein